MTINKNTKLMLFKRSLESIISKLPNYQEFDVDSIKNRKDHILILVNGFEYRANEFLRNASETKYKAKTVLIAKYSTNPKDNAAQYQELETLVKSISNNYQEIDADNQQMSKNSIIHALKKYEGLSSISITIDISGASDRLILTIMYSLLQVRGINLNIIYYEAKVYFPKKEDYDSNKEDCIKSILETDIQEKDGVHTPYFSPINPGNFEVSYNDFLINIPTLKLNRPFAALLEYNGSFFMNQSIDSVKWILGKPEKHVWREKLQLDVLNRGLELRNAKHTCSDWNTIGCSTLNYKSITQELFSIIDKQERKNISIMAMGSKMQTIGVALTLFARSECRVILVKPKEFNPSSYSEGAGKPWQLIFNLDNVKLELKKIGTYSNKPVGAQNTDQLPSS